MNTPRRTLFDPSESKWLTFREAMELASNQIWFTATVSREHGYGVDEPCRTYFLRSFDQVRQLTETDDQEDKLLGVTIVTPPHVNGAALWAIDSLAKVWIASKASAPSQKALVYETRIGERFSCSLFDSAPGEFDICSLIVELPDRTA